MSNPGRALLISAFPKQFSDFTKVNQPDENGQRPLQWAVKHGNMQFLKAVLDAGADPNYANDQDGITPLHRAIEFGFSNVVKELLKAGAAANRADAYGNTPLHWAAEYDANGNIYDLLHYGADVNYVNHFGKTPLYIAVQEGKMYAVNALLNLGADVNRVLQKAAQKGDFTVTENLKRVIQERYDEAFEKLRGVLSFDKIMEILKLNGLA